jgi:hypothetical protein
VTLSVNIINSLPLGVISLLGSGNPFHIAGKFPLAGTKDSSNSLLGINGAVSLLKGFVNKLVPLLYISLALLFTCSDKLANFLEKYFKYPSG